MQVPRGRHIILLKSNASQLVSLHYCSSGGHHAPINSCCTVKDNTGIRIVSSCATIGGAVEMARSNVSRVCKMFIATNVFSSVSSRASVKLPFARRSVGSFLARVSIISCSKRR